MSNKNGYKNTSPKKSQMNSYALLQLKMSEVQKSKKASNAFSKNNPSSSTTSKPDNLKGNSVKMPPKEKHLDSAPQKKGSPFNQTYGQKKLTIKDPDIPDRKFGDYFCSICDSHMNSDAMWDAHITGKRHLRNVKKDEPDSKYEDLDVESSVKYEVRNVKDPIIGLSYIHEIRRKEPAAPPLYTCFLCRASIATVPLVIEHVISMKHRLNYMKENSPEDYQLLDATNLKKGHMEPLVQEIALKLEGKVGRGTVKVKQEKAKGLVFPPYKRYFDSDDEDMHRKPSKARKYEEKNPYVWKAVDVSKRESIKDIRSNNHREIRSRKKSSYPSDDERDVYKQDEYKSYSRMSDRDDYMRRSDYDAYSTQTSSKHNNQLSPGYESSSPPYRSESSKKEFYPSTPSRSPSEDRYLHTRSYQMKAKPSQSTDIYSKHETYQMKEATHSSDVNRRPETKVTGKPDTNSEPLKDFVEKVYSLPTEIFLKIVLLKMENMELKGIDELSLLSKVISRSQVILCNKLPPDVQAVIKQKMSQNSENTVQKNSATPSVSAMMSQTTEAIIPSSDFSSQSYKASSSEFQGSDFSFIKDLFHRSKENADSSSSVCQKTNTSYQQTTANQNAVPSYQSLGYPSVNSSYQNNTSASLQMYPYSSNQSSSISSGIPGLTLTEEKSPEAHSYDTYQPQYPWRGTEPRPGYSQTGSEPRPSYTPYRY